MPTASVVVELEPSERFTDSMERAAHEEGATLDEYFLRLATTYLQFPTNIFEKVVVTATG
jgi:hypothetical protein